MGRLRLAKDQRDRRVHPRCEITVTGCLRLRKVVIAWPHQAHSWQQLDEPRLSLRCPVEAAVTLFPDGLCAALRRTPLGSRRQRVP